MLGIYCNNNKCNPPGKVASTNSGFMTVNLIIIGDEFANVYLPTYRPVNDKYSG